MGWANTGKRSAILLLSSFHDRPPLKYYVVRERQHAMFVVTLPKDAHRQTGATPTWVRAHSNLIFCLGETGRKCPMQWYSVVNGQASATNYLEALICDTDRQSGWVQGGHAGIGVEV